MVTPVSEGITVIVILLGVIVVILLALVLAVRRLVQTTRQFVRHTGHMATAMRRISLLCFEIESRDIAGKDGVAPEAARSDRRP